MQADVTYRVGLGQGHLYRLAGTRQRELLTFLYPASAEPTGFAARR